MGSAELSHEVEAYLTTADPAEKDRRLRSPRRQAEQFDPLGLNRLIPSCHLNSKIKIRKIRPRPKFFRVSGEII